MLRYDYDNFTKICWFSEKEVDFEILFDEFEEHASRFLLKLRPKVGEGEA